MEGWTLDYVHSLDEDVYQELVQMIRDELEARETPPE